MSYTEIAPEEQTELELDIIKDCNELLKDTQLTLKKIRKSRSVKYCLMMEGYDILCSDNIISAQKFCKNKKDIANLEAVGAITVKDRKEKEAANA